MTTVHRITDASSPDLQVGARLIADAFAGDVWPRGSTPAVLQWRTQVLARGVQLGNLGKPARVYVAKDTSGNVIGVTYWAITSTDDPSAKWKDIVPAPALPTANGDMSEELWKYYQGAFERARLDVCNLDNRVDLNFLVVHPDAQRSGAGTMLLQRCIEEVGTDAGPIFLISAATPSAGPFYAKRGLTELQSKDLMECKGFPDSTRKFGAWVWRGSST